MTPLASLDAVTSRIASIQARFAVPDPGAFAAALETAQTGAAGGGTDADAEVVPTIVGPSGAAAGTGTPAAYAVRLADVAGLADSSGLSGLAGMAGGPAAGTASGASAGEWASRLPAAGRQWAGAIEQAATAAGVDPALLASLVWAESGFDAGAGSGAGAIGLTQLMPATARGLGVDPHNPVENLQGGARYLREQLDRFGRNDLALAAYNAGPGAVSRHGGIPPFDETRAYVPRVLGYHQQLKGVS